MLEYLAIWFAISVVSGLLFGWVVRMLGGT